MQIRLEFVGSGQTYEAGHDPQTLTEWLRHENLPLNTRCGERGLCHACEVEVVQPDGSHTIERACQVALRDGLSIRVPEAARLAYRPQVMSSYRIGVPFALASEWGSEGIVAAVDIGTTTVSVVCLDLQDGSVVGTASSFNNQIALGDDVLTRINRCRTDTSAVDEFHRLLWDQTLLPLAAEAAGDRLPELCAWTLAGNTTMLHLALQENPGPMGVAPFPVPKLGSRREGSLRALPNAAAYLGADIVAGLVATGFVYEAGPALYVDIGTNGEIVCLRDGKLAGCATAAGPAFEGSGLSCGVRAGDGAIAHLRVGDDGKFEVEQIGDPKAKPLGICGSAYVDFLAEGFRAGKLTAAGRATPGAADGTDEHEGATFRLGMALGKRPIDVTERDVSRLLQAKAAIAAGIQTLLEVLDVRPSEVTAVYLAGGFGMHIDIGNAVACGLLPGFRPDQVLLVGNASLSGAHLAALDQGALKEMETVASRIEMVELNLQPGFEDAYLDHLSLDPPY